MYLFWLKGNIYIIIWIIIIFKKKIIVYFVKFNYYKNFLFILINNEIFLSFFYVIWLMKRGMYENKMIKRFNKYFNFIKLI